MHRPWHGFLVAITNLLIPSACLLFALGFFPYRPFISGLAGYENLEYDEVPPPQFDKVVFMVVDALRSDFVFSHRSGFHSTQRLISDGYALPFTAHATAPTVTMPRLKAITTGSIPSFVDMILNFAVSDTTSSLAGQDTWLTQMKAKGSGKLLLYGDDTWLKLFPKTFDRFDGTSSFFVSDFTEVDYNVTRHLPAELGEADWDVMVLHYLGIDHIGHKAGPRSTNMIPKQKEMDDIVQQIYHALETEAHLSSALLILCGDHGMNEAGNHGGSSPGETSPALVFISPRLRSISDGMQCPTEPKQDFVYYEMVEQSDIVPTLAGLLGIPVSLNSLGVFVPHFLPLWPRDKQKIQLVLGNALQLLNIVRATFPHPYFDDSSAPLSCNVSGSSANELACAWRDVMNATQFANDETPDLIISVILRFCQMAQDHLSSMASNYNLFYLWIGLVLASLTTFIAVIVAFPSFRIPPPHCSIYFTCAMVIYAVTMLASSYIEEEQNFWYWIAGLWFTLQVAQVSSLRQDTAQTRNLLLLLISLSVERRWNQSGQKHAGSPDIVSTIRRLPSAGLWIQLCITFVNIFNDITWSTLAKLDQGKVVARSLAAVLVIICFLFKVAFTSNDEPELLGRFDLLQPSYLIDLAQLVYKTTGCSLLLVLVARLLSKSRKAASLHKVQPLFLHTVHSLLTLLLVTQSRVTNIPLFLIFSCQMHLLASLNLPLQAITVATILMAHVSFFAMGNTNAISSIDLSNAYNGISDYNAPLVGFLLFIGNWAGPIYWSLSGLLLILKQSRREAQLDARRLLDQGMRREDVEKAADLMAVRAWIDHVTLLTLFVAVAATSVMAACMILRDHLFVWTVFSPKFLYTLAWVGGWHLGVNVVLGGFFAWMA